MMVFLAVVETGSFTLAAERLGIPKANVSRKVSRLESSLGVTLLERSTRSQRLTEIGLQYLEHCKRIHQEIDLAESVVGETLTSLKGPLKIGASVTIGQQILKPALPLFLHQYAEIDLNLNLINRRVDLIEEGFDMLIRVGHLEDSRLVARHLGTAHRSLFASKDYQEQHGLPLSIEDLSRHRLLLMSQMSTNGSLDLSSNGEHMSLKVEPRLLVDDFSILKESMLEGLGIAPLPDYMCDQDEQCESVIRVLPEWSLEPVEIYALYPKHRAKIPRVKAWLDFIVELFKTRLNEGQIH